MPLLTLGFPRRDFRRKKDKMSSAFEVPFFDTFVECVDTYVMKGARAIGIYQSKRKLTLPKLLC
jgi:hypothetical protein